MRAAHDGVRAFKISTWDKRSSSGEVVVLDEGEELEEGGTFTEQKEENGIHKLKVIM